MVCKLCLTHTDHDDYLMIADEILQFGPGLLQHNVSIPIVNDNSVEAVESFSTVLTTTTAGITLAPSESLIYILDNGNRLLCAKIEVILTSYCYRCSGWL